MKILLLGSGGREHAFDWKLAQSPHCEALFIAPGNAGTAACGTNLGIGVSDFQAQADFCAAHGVDFVVVGPEVPLVEGVWDYFTNREDVRHIPVIGPSAQGAMLEGSKSFAKAFMQRHNIPTAAYREFSADEMQEGLDYLAACPVPVVLKADGLAAGKGVLICPDNASAVQGFRELTGGKFGEAGARVVVEEFMTGLEFSVFVLTDGHAYKILPVAKDYKRIGEGDTGLNTGGMGAVSPPPFVTDHLLTLTEETVIKPSLEGLRRENIPYTGFLYIGLMNTPAGPRVVEYNCRMGDPETQVVLPRIDSDLAELLHATGQGRLSETALVVSPQAAATVILASGGYPEDYAKGKAIANIDQAQGCVVFHAGTRLDGDGRLLTAGGRVLAVTALAPTWQEAVARANEGAARIGFEGKYYRRDIGFDLA